MIANRKQFNNHNTQKVYDNLSSLSVRPTKPYDSLLVLRKPTVSDPTDIALNALKINRLDNMKLIYKLYWFYRIVFRKRRCSLKKG